MHNSATNLIGDKHIVFGYSKRALLFLALVATLYILTFPGVRYILRGNA